MGKRKSRTAPVEGAESVEQTDELAPVEGAVERDDAPIEGR